jgi:5,10-methylenetetrahydromethanopterin reductase
VTLAQSTPAAPSAPVVAAICAAEILSLAGFSIVPALLPQSGPRNVEYALLAEELGFRAVWCPEIPAFGHDIWVTLAHIAEKTKRIKFGPSVLIPSYRHPMAQASAIATLEQIAPGRLMVGFGTGFTGRAGMGKKPLSLASMRTHIVQVKALLRGDIADIDGGLAQILASDGWLPDRPVRANIPRSNV